MIRLAPSLSVVPYHPPSNVRLAKVRTEELIFSWKESADRPIDLYYIINSICETCPNMAFTTMATCSDLNVSTTLTTCAFSIQSAACGTIGSSSLPVVVTLAGIFLSLCLSLSSNHSPLRSLTFSNHWRDYFIPVPDIPDAAIIPQYSQNGGQLLIAIIVRVKQNVSHGIVLII